LLAAPQLHHRWPQSRETPQDGVTGALDVGSDVAQSGMDSGTTEKPSNKVIGAATIAGLLFLLIAVASGIGVAIGFLGLVALVVGIVAVIRGGAAWARIVSRRAAVAVAAAGFVAMAVGGALAPETKTDNTASEAPAATTSAAPTTSAPRTTQAAPQPLVAAPVTSAAPVLPAAPVMAISCPAGGSVASPVYGQQISATAPFTVTIDYGDGDVYTNDDQNLPAIFSHTYKAAGTFAVSAALTDAVGQMTTATCSYTWAKPVQAASVGGSSSGTASGGGAVAGGGAVSDGGAASGGGSAGGGAAAGGPYANCDAVRAAGAAPIHPGDPGFEPKFDRDGDGVGCE
jgi:uncharacterized membrane protein YgcG